jgi:hypothetical protein
MQVTSAQTVATAAVATAALVRFRHGYASPSPKHQGESVHHASMRPAHSASTRTKTLSLMLRVSHLFRLWHSSVRPIVSQAGYTQRLSEIADEYQQLLAESLPLPRDLVNKSPDSSRSMPQAAPLHPRSFPAAVRACVEQQAACILGHLRHASDLSHLNDPPGILSQRADKTGLVALINKHEWQPE